MEASIDTNDPLWRMLPYMGYGKISARAWPNIINAPSGGMAGLITAALFLKRFVINTKRWAHFDIYGRSLSERHHSSIGGKTQGIRALFHYISHQFAK